MKRMLILITLTLLVACGAEPSTPPTTHDGAREAAEKIFFELRDATPPPVRMAARPLLHDPDPVYYAAWNSQTTIPQQHTNGSACYIVNAQGSSGYAGQPTWPNGQPKDSANWYFERYFPSTMNVVSSQYLDGVGTKVAMVACSPLTDFNNIGTTYQHSYSFYRTIGNGYGQGPYDVEAQLFDTNSFCYLMHLGGLTHSGAAEYVYQKAHAGSPTGYYWYLRHAGTGANFAAQANCVWLGRPVPYQNRYVAYTNQPAWLDENPSHACFITGVWGDLNNGAVWIATAYPDSRFRLFVSGAVWGASAECVPYWDTVSQ